MVEKLQLTKDDYSRADRMLPWNFYKLIGNTTIKPVWFENEERFWYLSSGPWGKRFILVDPVKGEKTMAFDHEALASSFSVASGKPCTGNQLPFEKIEWINDAKAIRFGAYEKFWVINLHDYTCAETTSGPAPKFFEILSPDKKWVAFSKDYNIWVRNLETSEEYSLTQDGELHNDYGTTPEANTNWITMKLKTGGVLRPWWCGPKILKGY
jgi:dipeptidyl-peptidase 4